MKTLLTTLFGLLYRVEVRGLLNYHKTGERTVIIANHVSFLDGLLLAAYLPTKPTFAIASHMARKWWLNWPVTRQSR